jgi:hypothetical protein
MLFKINKVRCKKCKDNLVSINGNDEDTCTCGDITIYGGLFVLGRKRNRKKAEYEELSEVNMDYISNRNLNEKAGDLEAIKAWQKSQIRK